MKRSICGAVAGFGLGALVVYLLEANNVLSGHISAQHSNSLVIVASLSILGAVIGGTGDIVAAIRQGKPAANPEGEDKTSVSMQPELRGKSNE